MSGRFVRASKYRHVFGRNTRKEQCYDNLRVSRNAWDTNLVKANPKYLSVNWESSGGGAFAVIPLEEKGKLPEVLPLFRGHTAVVLDTDWNPFNDSIIASGSDDGKVFIWKVPEGFTLFSEDEEPKDVSPVARLSGHTRKVGHVLWNPSAENVLATSSGDFTIKIWDGETGTAKLTLKHADVVQSLSWSANGGLMVTTSRDKKLRVWDVRQEKPAHVGQGHAGAKNSRAVWMGEHDRVATTGFSKMSDRQLGLWDIRNANEPVGGFDQLDSISGICMPFWDDGTQCLYLAGKGDGNIRYFEYENDKFEYLSEYKSADPQRGIAFMPKRGVNIHENEVMRAFKTVNDSYIEPISFIVPRRAEVFQSDIYPPVIGLKPGMSASQWFDGKDGLPPKYDLESAYSGSAPTEVASDYKPAAPLQVVAEHPAKAPEPVKEKSVAAPTSTTAAGARAPTNMKEQGASMSNMASRFADKEESESEDDDSSFEEVSRPPARAAGREVAEPKSTSPVKAASSSTAPSAPAASASSARPASPVTSTAASPAQTTSRNADGMWRDSRGAAPAASTLAASNAGVSGGEPLAEIKALLLQHKTALAGQSEMLVQLTSEVEQLRREVKELKGKKMNE